MSVDYTTIIASVALRVNAIVGTLPTTLQANYIVSPLTTTQVVSSIFPLADLQEAVLWAEERLADAIANNGTHPWRTYLTDQTTALSNLATLPSISTHTKPIIGVWGAVYDSSDFQICSLMPMDEVRRRVRNANSNYTCPVYWFVIASEKIVHTRTQVVVDCCVYDRTTQAAELASNGIILLADVLEPAYVAGAVAHLIRDDEFLSQSQVYSTYFNSTLSAISQGMQSVAPSMEVAA